MYRLRKSENPNTIALIERFFDKSKKKAYKYSELWEIYNDKKYSWNLDKKITFKAFLLLILEKTDFSEFIFRFPSRTEKRYIWRDSSNWEIISSLNQNAYFTHNSAVILNNLSKKNPNAYYINVEQKEKLIPNSGLSQESIDRAFKNRPRITSNIAEFGRDRIFLLNGKFTNLLGVIKNKENIRFTDIERTLIDISVRPVYSGDVFDILNVYRNSSGKISIDKIIEYIIKLDYTYPYHQAVGFYFNKTGLYPKKEIDKFKTMGIMYNFYLTYNMGSELAYSDEWKIFYPKDL